MYSVLKVVGCFFFCSLVFISMTVAHQPELNKRGWQNDSTKINTEQVDIDFATTSLLESITSAKKTKEGIQPTEDKKEAVLISDKIPVPVENIAPFLALGSRLVMAQPLDDLDNIRLEIRSTVNNGQWSNWLKIESDVHLTTSRDTLVGTLMYLPKETNFIQFRIIWPGSTDTQSRQLKSLHLSFTSPGATSPKMLQKLKEQALRQPKRQKLEKQDYPMPDYVTRTEWGCPDGQEPSGPYSRTDITHQIVHHSAGTNTSSDWPAVVRSIWDYHVNTNGWSDIGYNWLVDPNGVIYQGRGWIDGEDEVQGAHFCGTNSNTMGVCVLGNFQEVSPTSNAQNSLEDLLAWKSDEKNIDPTAERFHSSSGLNLFTISGHRDGCSTLCPGENLYVQLPSIRKNVNAKIGESDEVAADIVLEHNYPNPFSESTTIGFTLERPGNVRITIWDITGRMIEQVADRYYEAESHSESWNASNFSSGIYFCRIEFDGEAVLQKMVLVK